MVKSISRCVALRGAGGSAPFPSDSPFTLALSFKADVEVEGDSLHHRCLVLMAPILNLFYSR